MRKLLLLRCRHRAGLPTPWVFTIYSVNPLWQFQRGSNPQPPPLSSEEPCKCATAVGGSQRTVDRAALYPDLSYGTILPAITGHPAGGCALIFADGAGSRGLPYTLFAQDCHASRHI